MEVLHHHPWDFYYHRSIYRYWGWGGWGGWCDFPFGYGWYDFPYYCGLRGVVSVKTETSTVPVAPPPPVETQLKKMSVSLFFEGAACVRVVVEQTYQNQTTTPLEVSYNLGLGRQMAVSGFEAEVDGTRVAGKVREAQQARDAYDDGISQGHTPMLGERTSGGSFSMALGNLQPGKTVAVRVELLAALEAAENGSDAVFFGLPAAMFPAQHVVYELVLSASIVVEGGCRTITVLCNDEAPKSVPCSSESSTFEYSRTFEAGKPNAKGIFGVEFQPCKAFVPVCVFEESPLDPTNYSAVLTFTPDWSSLDRQAMAPCVEVFILLDQSGSMGENSGGKKRIVQAKEACSLFLSSLPEGSRFQIIGFGSRYSLLFNQGPQPLNEATLKLAASHVASIQADMGGTSLLEPLEVVLEEPASSEFPRCCFLLTDGAVENTDEVLKLVRTRAKSTRIFAIGIGGEADQTLVKGLAKEGRGLYDFVADTDSGNKSLQTVVVRQLAKALEPTLRKPQIQFVGCKPARVLPETLPAVLNGDRLQVYASDVKLETSDGKQISAIVTGVAPDSSIFSQAVLSQHTVGNTISKLCAWQEILTLQEQLEGFEEQLKKARPKSRPFNEATSKVNGAKASITALGLKYGLATKFTSWIAVFENKEFASTSMVNVAIPSLNDPKKEPEKPVVTTTTTTTFVEQNYFYDAPSYSTVTVVSSAGRGSSVSSVSKVQAPSPARTPAAQEQKQQQQQQQQPQQYYERRNESSYRDEAECEDSSSGYSDSKRKEKVASKKMSRDDRSSSPSSSSSMESSSRRAAAGAAPPSSSSAPPPPALAASMSSRRVSTWEEFSAPELLVATRGDPASIVPIAKLQEASGAWQLASVLQFFPEAKNYMAQKPIESEVVWTTALTIAFLMKNKPDDEPTWSLLVQKGRYFVRKWILERGLKIDPVALALKMI